MNDVTRILSAIEQGEPEAAEQLLPLVYDELRKLATQRLAQEKPGQTLQATALVHDAYLRLVDVEKVQQWDSRGHFFTAAAEAMRRILIDNARRKRAEKHGGTIREPAGHYYQILTRSDRKPGRPGPDNRGGLRLRRLGRRRSKLPEATADVQIAPVVRRICD